MKILIAPFISSPKADAAYHLTRTLADLLGARQHAVAVSARRESAVPGAALYDAAECRVPLFFKEDRYTYEEWLYGCGGAQQPYLDEDFACIEKAIDRFSPDLIIIIDRVAAAAAARKHKIPSLCIVSSPAYRTGTFPAKMLRDINRMLYEQGFEQVFRISELYDYCPERVVFGPVHLQPMPLEADFRRFGTFADQPPVCEEPNGIYIYLDEVRKKPAALKKMVIDTFSGAKYPVYARISGAEAEKTGNVQFLAMHRDDIMKESSVCIHDGNEYICALCAAAAIPQLIITDHSYGRTADALAARRYGFGVMMDEDELSVASLYENYRRLVSSSRFREDAAIIRDEIISSGDFTDFHRFLINRFGR